MQLRRTTLRATDLDDELYLADDGGTGAAAVKDVVRNARRSVRESLRGSILKPEVEEALEEVAPDLLAWLKTMPGIFLEMLVFVSFVAVDVAKNLSMSLALRNSDWQAQGVVIVTASLVLATNLALILVGLIVGVLVDGIASLRQILDVRGAAYRSFGGAAILYALAQICCTMAYTAMAPGTIMLVGQVRLLNTALFSRFLLGRTYKNLQWCLMVLIILSAVVHIWAKDTSSELHALHSADGGPLASKGEGDTTALGFCYLAIYFLAADLASIIIEKSSKEKNVPFWLQMTVISIVSVPITLAMSWLVPTIQALLGSDEAIWGPQMWWATAESAVAQNCVERVMSCGMEAGGFWRDWDQPLIWLALGLNSLAMWTAGFIVKILSSTTKKLAKVIVFCLVYFLGDCWLLRQPEDGSISAGAALAAVQVMTLTYAFFFYSK
jgi:hypothetical protein